MMQKVTSKDGTEIAFDKTGRGPALILVGGAFQYRALDPRTAQLAALLSLQFTVFHYDRRGRGDSSDVKPYAVEREVEDIRALINEAGEAAFVFGMSSGGVLALEAAARGLAIASQYRRQGIATGLLNSLKRIAREHGVYVIFVQADVGDIPAIRLYESLGTKEDVHQFDIPV